MRTLILALILATAAQAAHPPTPWAAEHARRAAREAVRRNRCDLTNSQACSLSTRYGVHGGCVHAAEAAVAEFARMGYEAFVLEIPETRYQQGHALGIGVEPRGGVWVVDPRGDGALRGWDTRLTWAPDAATAGRRWAHRPSPPFPGQMEWP